MIAVVYGTRPEAIKLAPVVRALRALDFEEVRVFCTNQSPDLLLDTGLVPDETRSFVNPPSLSELIGEVLFWLDPWLRARHPIGDPLRKGTGGFVGREVSTVVVQGDTASAFAGALAGFHARVPVVHVEAGLRTYDIESPFPEEGYRQMISRIAARHYAPTPTAAEYLRDEGVGAYRILVTGQTGIDAAFQAGPGTSMGAPPYVLATLHRRETTEEELAAMARGLRRLWAETKLSVVFPAHPNSSGRLMAQMLDGAEGVHVIPPLPYRDAVATLRAAHLVVTDSGGLQEEAAAFGIPTLVARDATERHEGVRAGVARLIGRSEEGLVREVKLLMEDPAAFNAMARPTSVYGDGKASERIAEDLRARAMQPKAAW